MTNPPVYQKVEVADRLLCSDVYNNFEMSRPHIGCEAVRDERCDRSPAAIRIKKSTPSPAKFFKF